MRHSRVFFLTLILLVGSVRAADLYWVGSGPFSNAANWSASSGGQGGIGVPGSGDTAHFDGNGLGDANLSAAVNVRGIDIGADYTGTITQGGYAITVGSVGWSQAGGIFSGSDDGTKNMTVNGVFTLSGGTFISTTGKLTVVGTYWVAGFTHNGGIFAHNDGTVEFHAAGFSTNMNLNAPNGDTFNNLTFSSDQNDGSGSTILGQPLVVLGTLTHANGAINTGTVEARGDVVISKTDSRKGGNGIISFTADGDQTITSSGGNTAMLSVNKPSGSVSVTGDLSINKFNLASGTFNCPSGKLTVVATYWFGGFTHTGGTFNHNNGVVEFFASGPSTHLSLAAPNGETFNNLIFNSTFSDGSGSTISGQPLVVLGTLTHANGAIDAGSVEARGNFVVSKTDPNLGGTGTISFTVGDDQTITSSGGNTAMLNIDKPSGAVAVTGDLSINGFNLASGAFACPTGKLTVVGHYSYGGFTHSGGSFNHNNGSVEFRTLGCSTHLTLNVLSGEFFNNLTFSADQNDGSGSTILGQPLTVLGTLTQSGGAVDSGTIEARGDVVVSKSAPMNDGSRVLVFGGAANQSFTAASTQTWPFAGLLVNKTGGTLSLLAGLTTPATISLAPGIAVSFKGGATYSFGGVDWHGTPASPIVLRSDAAGTQWKLKVAQAPLTVTYADVQDSDASGGGTLSAFGSTNSGNNLNWNFDTVAQVGIATAGNSISSPAWVEGSCGADVTTLFCSVNGTDASTGLVRLSPAGWFADNASANGDSFGVALSPMSATHVEFVVTNGFAENSTGQDISWTPTDLKGNIDSSKSVTIRKGDSLLLTDTEPGTSVWIDTGNGGTPTSHGGAPGDLFACKFAAAGSYLLTAAVTKDDNSQVLHYLNVIVVSADLHSPVACQLNYQRGLTVYTAPGSQAANVTYQSENPAALAVSLQQCNVDGARLGLKPLQTGTPLFSARLGGATGPMLAVEPVLVFEMTSLNRVMMGFTVDDDGFGHGLIRLQITPRLVIDNDKPETPAKEGLYFDLSVSGSGFCFDKDPATDYYGANMSKVRVHSKLEDAEGILSVPVILSPNGTVSCHSATAVQINSDECCGSTPANNPFLKAESRPCVLLQRNIAWKVNREGATNVYASGDHKDKEIFKVWDYDGGIDGRWTSDIQVPNPATPAALEAAFFPVLKLSVPNRWFTVKTTGGQRFLFSTRLAPSRESRPIGGRLIPDNDGVDRDEVATGEKATFGTYGPNAFPALNVAPNQFIRKEPPHASACHPYQTNSDAMNCLSWNEAPLAIHPGGDEPVFTDFGFYKGNMIGSMDMYLGVNPTQTTSAHNYVPDFTRPGAPLNPHSHLPAADGFTQWVKPQQEIPFPDLIKTARLEADGYTGTGDASSRDRFPDVVGANVYEAQREIDDPENPTQKKTIACLRTQSPANPVPVQITLFGPASVQAAVSLATAAGGKTNKAWVSDKPDEIFELRGADGTDYSTDASKADTNEVWHQVRNEDGTTAWEEAERMATFGVAAGGSKVVYVYGLEPTKDLDELRLTVWGKESVCDYKALGPDKHQNQSTVAVPMGAYYGFWCITDQQPLNVVSMQWVDHEKKPVNMVSETTPEDQAPYNRDPGQPGGVGGYGGPHPDTGFAYFQDAFRFDSLVFHDAGADGLKTITCNMTSNVSDVPTNGLDNTNSFTLKQLSAASFGYAADNGVLGLMLISDPQGAAGQRKTFTASVANDIFGFKGTRTFYETGVGTNTYQTRRVLLTATLDALPDPTTIQTMTATLTSDVPGPNGDLTTEAVALSETAVDSSDFVSADGQFDVKIDRITANGDVAPNDFTASVSSALLDVAGQEIDAIESGNGTLEFRTDLLHNALQPPLIVGQAMVAIGKQYLVAIHGNMWRATYGGADWPSIDCQIRIENGPSWQAYKLGADDVLTHLDGKTPAVFEFKDVATAPIVDPQAGTEHIVFRLQDVTDVYVAPGHRVVAETVDGTVATVLNVVKLVMTIYNGGSDLDNGEAKGEQGSVVPDSKKNSVGAFLLVNWDDDEGTGMMRADGSWAIPPKPDLEKTSVVDEDNLARLELNVFPIPDRGVLTLKVKGSTNCVKLWKFSDKRNSPIDLTNNQKTWDLSVQADRDDFGEIFWVNHGIWIEGIQESTAERDVQFEFSLDADGRNVTKDTASATVVMVRLGNAVYRDNSISVMGIGFAARGHAALVTKFIGPCNAANLADDDKYLITEMAGPTSNKPLTTMTRASETARGCFTNPAISYVERLKILKTAAALAQRSITYVLWTTSAACDAVMPEDWNGRLNAITALRCDGLVEVCYEINGVEAWGSSGPPGVAMVYALCDVRDNWSYNAVTGGWTSGYNGYRDSLEVHNDFDVWDWKDTLNPATQAGYVGPTGSAATKFRRNNLCIPVGSKGGN